MGYNTGDGAYNLTMLFTNNGFNSSSLGNYSAGFHFFRSVDINAPLTVGTGYFTNLYINGTEFDPSNITVSYASDAGNAQFLGNQVYISANNNLRPISSGSSSCGTSEGLWTSVWASTATIQTSDERMKNSIENLDDRYELLFDKIVPKRFKMNNGTSNRFHLGIISQELEQSMQEVGIDSQEFAGLVKDPVYASRKLDEDGNETDEYDTTSEIIDYNYFIRYEEFIPLIIDKVQKQQVIIDSQTEKINELEQRLSKLEVA